MVRSGAWVLATALLVAGSGGAFACPGGVDAIAPGLTVTDMKPVALSEVISKLPADWQQSIFFVVIEGGAVASATLTDAVDAAKPKAAILQDNVAAKDISHVTLVQKAETFVSFSLCIKATRNGVVHHFAVPVSFAAPSPTSPSSGGSGDSADGTGGGDLGDNQNAAGDGGQPGDTELNPIFTVDSELDGSRPQAILDIKVTVPSTQKIDRVDITISTRGGTAVLNGRILPWGPFKRTRGEAADIKSLVVFPDPDTRPEALTISADIYYRGRQIWHGDKPINVSPTIWDQIIGWFEQLPGWLRAALIIVGFAAIVLAVCRGGLYLWSALMTFLGRKEKFRDLTPHTGMADLMRALADNFEKIFARLEALEAAQSEPPKLAAPAPRVPGRRSSSNVADDEVSPPVKQQYRPEPSFQQKQDQILRRYVDVVKDLSLGDAFVTDFGVQGASENGEGLVFNTSQRDAAFWVVPLDANGGSYFALPGRASIKTWADFLAPMNGRGAREQLGTAYDLEHGAELRLQRPAIASFDRVRKVLTVTGKGLLSGIN